MVPIKVIAPKLIFFIKLIQDFNPIYRDFSLFNPGMLMESTQDYEWDS